MDWKYYEEITKYIYELLGRESGVKIEGYGYTCKVKGKSGVYHQIDVLTSHSDGIHSYQTAIECKYWEEKINKDVIMKVAAIIEDTNIHKGVVVSKRGYTKDGVSFAKQKNIGLVELRELEAGERKEEAKDLSLQIGELIVNSKIERRRPEILNIKFDIVDPNQKSDKIKPNQVIIRFKDRKEVSLNHYLNSFKQKLHNEESDTSVQKHYKFKDATLVNITTKEEAQIRGLTLTGKMVVKNMDVKRQINIVDEIWLIMKSLFENNSYTISKMGMIKKDGI